MGVLNATPDSFSDGGLHLRVDAARAAAEAMVAAGAAIIDIGGESTRPGAAVVPVEEELRRVLPVIEALRDLPALLSVDTSHPVVIREFAATPEPRAECDRVSTRKLSMSRVMATAT